MDVVLSMQRRKYMPPPTEDDVRAKLEPVTAGLPLQQAIAATQAIGTFKIAMLLEAINEKTGQLLVALKHRR